MADRVTADRDVWIVHTNARVDSPVSADSHYHRFLTEAEARSFTALHSGAVVTPLTQLLSRR